MPIDALDLPLLERALSELARGFSDLPPDPSPAGDERAAIQEVLLETARRMRDNYPYHHPLYVGQMLKPPHPVARLAYALATWLNPNNHALDGGRASSAMEKEAVARLGALFGWDHPLGHLTGGGTLANLEALWVAREVAGAGVVLASSEAHYTHERLAGVLGVPFGRVAVDASGRMDVADLERRLAVGDACVVVATLGTTALGAVDPLPAILDVARARGVRVHVDAAYGGFFTLAGSLAAPARAAFDAAGRADSVVVDPHKHGLQPYGCGCVLFRDPAVGAVYRHDSPYTYFSSDELHLGEISLECSRPGAAAVGLWATQRLLPYEPGGRFAADLDRSLSAARELARRLGADPRLALVVPPELDIVVLAVRALSAGEASRRARRVFDEAARIGLHLALAAVPRALVERATGRLEGNEPTVTCLRMTTMKPEHAAWTDAIVQRLGRSLDAARS